MKKIITLTNTLAAVSAFAERVADVQSVQEVKTDQSLLLICALTKEKAPY
jgi:hypothetical protein